LDFERRLINLLCKRITVAKSREVNTGWNLAESSNEDYGSKRAVLPMMMMMMTMIIWTGNKIIRLNKENTIITTLHTENYGDQLKEETREI
jgi:hypothetical protein